MKRTILILLFLCVIFIPCYPEPPQFEAINANITAWNLSGFSPIPRQRAEIFANAITYLDPEVIVLVEVNPDFMAAEIASEIIDRTGICYKRAILDQTANQNIAVLCKHNVQLSNPRFIPGSDNNNSHLRSAFAVDVEIGEFDFILISLHMKAGRSNSDRQIRDNQAQAIANFIQTATAGGNERDVLIVGDYNMITGQDQSNFDNMNPGNFLNFISDSLTGFSHIGSHGPGNLLDGYAISREHTSEYITGSLQIIDMHQILGLSLTDYRNTVSDHLPLDAVFRISEDDD